MDTLPASVYSKLYFILRDKVRKVDLFDDLIKQLNHANRNDKALVVNRCLCLFGQAVRFLVETYGVNRFHIISDYCSSGYMSMLKRETKGVPHACIIGVANMPDMDEQEWGDYKAQHIPPCNRVENLNIPVSGARREELSVLAHLIEHSKFCLCDLSENMFAGDNRYYVAKSRGAVLLDIEKKHT